MDPSDAGQIVFLAILLMLSAFFSASETAVMSLSKIRLRHLQEQNVPHADAVGRLVDQPNKFLGSILVGNNLVNIGASAIATVLFTKYFGVSGAAIATAVMTVLILVFGEITPKSLAAANSESFSLKLAKPLSFIIWLFTPVTMIIMTITNGLSRLIGGRQDLSGKPFITQEELKTMVNVSHEEGVLEGDERKMINNVFAFGDSQAKDVMTPRTDMVALNDEATYDEMLALFQSEQYSRVPVYHDTPDTIVGVIYVKDLILKGVTPDNFNIHEILREPYFTYEFKRTAELFDDMRQKHLPVAIVLDEYGGTSGVVTMEDLVEEIVGEIADEYDLHDEVIEVIKEDEYIVDGAARIDLVNELIGTRIESEDFDSVGGYVIGEVGGLPQEGDTLTIDGVSFEVEKVEKNRIESLRIKT